MTPISVDPSYNEPVNNPNVAADLDAVSTQSVPSAAQALARSTASLRHVQREIAKRREIDRARETSADQGLSAADLL